MQHFSCSPTKHCEILSHFEIDLSGWRSTTQQCNSKPICWGLVARVCTKSELQHWRRHCQLPFGAINHLDTDVLCSLPHFLLLPSTQLHLSSSCKQMQLSSFQKNFVALLLRIIASIFLLKIGVVPYFFEIN